MSPRRHLVRALALFVVLLVPALAWAQTVSPSGYSGWNLYVYGNGEVLAEILENIRRMLAPDYGGGAFRTFLVFLSLAGFLFIVVQAAADPGRHMLRLATYVMLVWVVVFFGTRLTANVIVIDKLTGRTFTVRNAPAIVAVPASATSEFGHWMTRQIEMHYSYPELTVSQAPGGYSLLPRILDDASKFTITNPELRRSLGAFATDCVVPAIARGDLRGHELTTSPNLLETLRNARHNALMTVYYSTEAVSGQAPSCAGPAAGAFEGGLGAVMSCADAYACIYNDVVEHAQELLEAKASQWESTGVLLPYETAMTTALQYTGAPGNVMFAGRSRSHGFILQRAMVDSLRGSFRTAAMQTGNNELLNAVAVRQAEQMQRSTWWTASELFKTLMPYIYTVLQLFIFAIGPIVVVMLLIPGLGKSIVTNYTQILVWLTLWMPLLAVVNFIILAIAKNDLGALMPGGVTISSQYTIDEATNNLLMAANYLGTLVPLITWGLVKGTLAFTEFIQAGIGSSFAAQAGSTASTGNLSLGNVSMDNTSANKFSIAAASEIGDKGITAYLGAGSLLSKVDGGGASATFNGIAAQRNFQESLQQAVNANFSKSLSERFSQQNVYNELLNRGLDSSLALRLSESFKTEVTDRLSNTTFSNEEHARAETARLVKNWAQSQEGSFSASSSRGVDIDSGFRGNVGLDAGVAGFKVHGSWTTSASNKESSAYADKTSVGTQGDETLDGTRRNASGTSALADNSASTGSGAGIERSSGTTISTQQLRSHLQSFGNDVTSEVGTLYQESYQKARSSTASVGTALTGADYGAMVDRATGLSGAVGGALDSAQNQVVAGRATAGHAFGAAAQGQSQWDKQLKKEEAGVRGKKLGPPVQGPTKQPGSEQVNVQIVKDAVRMGRKGAAAGVSPYRDMSNNPIHPPGAVIRPHR